MDYQLLTLEIKNQVAWITINRPKAFNAIDLQASKELLDIANRIGSDNGVRAAVLTGTGNQAFCAGGDVAGFAKNPDQVPVLLKEMTAYLHMAISRLARMNAPLIARINGVAARIIAAKSATLKIDKKVSIILVLLPLERLQQRLALFLAAFLASQAARERFEARRRRISPRLE